MKQKKLKLLDKLKPKDRAKVMLSRLIKAGVRRSEIQQAAQCSRWMISLWLARENAPKEDSLRRITMAYYELMPPKSTRSMLVELTARYGEERLIDLIGCDHESYRGWSKGLHAPNAQYRRAIIHIYNFPRGYLAKNVA